MLIPQFLVLVLKLSPIYTVSLNTVFSIPQNQCYLGTPCISLFAWIYINWIVKTLPKYWTDSKNILCLKTHKKSSLSTVACRHLSRNVKQWYLHQYIPPSMQQSLWVFEKIHKSIFHMSVINNILPVSIALTDATSKCIWPHSERGLRCMGRATNM